MSQITLVFQFSLAGKVVVSRCLFFLADDQICKFCLLPKMICFENSSAGSPRPLARSHCMWSSLESRPWACLMPGGCQSPKSSDYIPTFISHSITMYDQGRGCSFFFHCPFFKGDPPTCPPSLQGFVPKMFPGLHLETNLLHSC